MKKNLFKTMSVAAMAAFTLAACNNAAPKMDEQPAAVPQGGMKIAYVEVDSLASQYQFCIDYTKILEKKRTNATNTLNQKGQQLQAAMNNFQQKINNNQFRSREEAENAQLAIQRSQQSLQELQNRLGAELEKEAADFSVALKDSLDHFLAIYNKDKKFDLILSKSDATSNILFADKRYDITQDVINGLNKRYKPTAATQPKKDEDNK
ncbi:MAG: OmpH family outer membrane protein [Prevotella sp.]|jgi:outer membrane protein|nr:OmpH family outer membrane protein [Prevotella sp.]